MILIPDSEIRHHAEWAADRKSAEYLRCLLEDRARLLEFARFAVEQFRGESGAGENYWVQFPEYRAAVAQIEGQPAEKGVTS